MKEIQLSLFFLIGILPAVHAQGTGLERESTWKGFTQHNFQFDQRNAWVVAPSEALPGNPWVWRARFPNYHADVDSILVSKGFHLAYVNTNGMFGSPASMEIWNKFYEYVTQTYSLNDKVALEGVSRGGLFIYSWAKQNPKKVNSIYADAPVSDIKSWPGPGKKYRKTWDKLKAEYGFKSDSLAKAYTNNPIDNLEILAKHNIPVLHMIGLNDKVVPPEENTFILINRYIRLGGVATVVPSTSEPQTLEGHHFPIERPEMIVDFIQHHSQ